MKNKMEDGILVLGQEEWDGIRAKFSVPLSHPNSAAGGERKAMSEQSSLLKGQWTNTLETNMRKKAETKASIQQKLESEAVDLENRYEHKENLRKSEIIQRAKKLAFRGGEEVRRFQGGLLHCEALMHWKAQIEQKRKIREIHKQSERRFDEHAASQLKDAGAKEQMTLQAKKAENRNLTLEVREKLREFHKKTPAVRDRAAAIKNHIQELQEESAKEAAEKSDQKRELQKGLETDRQLRETREEAKYQKAIQESDRRKEYIRDKLRTIQLLRTFEKKQREAINSRNDAVNISLAETNAAVDQLIKDRTMSMVKYDTERDAKEQAARKAKHDATKQIALENQQKGSKDKNRRRQTVQFFHDQYGTELKKHMTISEQEQFWLQEKKKAQMDINKQNFEMAQSGQAKEREERVRAGEEIRQRLLKEERLRQEEAKNHLDDLIQQKSSEGWDVRPLEKIREAMLVPAHLRRITVPS